MKVVAPAGSKKSLIAAVNAGADAVYLGLPLFGARAKAENFSLDTLKTDVDYAHLFGCEVFVTLNTLIKDDEMELALEYAKRAVNAGVDAGIVQDVRYIKKLKSFLPNFRLHASTQMGVHNAFGAKTLLDMGIDYCVLSRETTAQDIEQIKKTGMEVEFFVQGALCASFSGNCYFSSLASSYSGNRGKCMQLCRKPYYRDEKKGYFLSTKDLCLYSELDRLKNLGVDAIKIEGRMRSETYVAQAVKVYKSAMPVTKAENALKAVFNRGDYCKGYLDDGDEHNVIYDKAQGNVGVSVGKVTSISGDKITVSGFKPYHGDGFKIMRDGREVCGAKEVNGAIVKSGKCLCGDEARRTFDGELADALSKSERKIPIKVDVTLTINGAKVSASADDIKITCEEKNLTSLAKSQEITAYDVVSAFGKAGDYPFLPSVKVTLQSGLFVAVSALNKFRRGAYDKLYNAILTANAPKETPQRSFNLRYNKFTGSGVILSVRGAAQLNDEILNKVDYVAISPLDYKNFEIPKIDKPVLLNAPVVARGKDVDIVKAAIEKKEIFGVISNNLYTLSLTDKPILLGVGHNIIGDCEYPHITSYEADKITDFCYIFGYAPVMTFCFCPHHKCVNCNGGELTDEAGRRYKITRYKLSHCYGEMLNCVPHDLTKKFFDYKNKFYDCRDMKAYEILSVLNGDYSCQHTLGNLNRGLK